MLLSRADVRESFIASSHPCSSHFKHCWCCGCSSLATLFLSCAASLGHKLQQSLCQAQQTSWHISTRAEQRAFSSWMAQHRAQQVCTECKVPPDQVHTQCKDLFLVQNPARNPSHKASAALSRSALWNGYDVQQREWDFDTVNSLWQSCKPVFIYRFLSMSAGDTKWNFRYRMFSNLAATLQGKAALSLSPGYHGCSVWHSKKDSSCHVYFAGACDSLETGTSFVSTSYGSGDMFFILTLPKYGCSQSYPASYPVTSPLPLSAIVICILLISAILQLWQYL